MTKKIQWVLCNKEADKDTRAEEKAEVIVPEASQRRNLVLQQQKRPDGFTKAFQGMRLRR